MEIIFERCPSCDTHACAFAVIDGKTHCPMCAPVPDREPHDYKPLQTGGAVKLTDAPIHPDDITRNEERVNCAECLGILRLIER